jgi:glycosyltransferase involved in cell wall biosynthesis
VLAPYVAVTHHPLAYETGIPRDRAASLLRTERANLKCAAHVIVPSPHTAQILSADFGVESERLTVAPPGILRPEPMAGEKPAVPEILVVGQLVPRKGHDILLRAFASLTDLDWTASIVGRASDDAHGRYLRDLASRLGISARVRFKGVVAPDALAACYARASVFALATRYEGYGMVFAEAMVHGLPIVTCATGAVPDTVPADAGMLVPADDVGAFAGALRRVLSDEGYRNALASGSARHAQGLPSWDDTARIVSAVLQNVVP